MPYQLRIYTINRGMLADFTKAWREGVYPLRLQHGFRIPAAWTVEQTNQFIWYIGYDGTDDWTSKEQHYYSSTARANLNPDPAQWIARAEQYFVESVIPIASQDA